MKVSFTNGPITVLVELDEQVVTDIARDTAHDFGINMTDFRFEEIDGYV